MSAKPTTTIDRRPPFDLQAETGVLGSIMLMPELFAEVDPILSERDFYDEGHAKIYRAMQAVVAGVERL